MFRTPSLSLRYSLYTAIFQAIPASGTQWEEVLNKDLLVKNIFIEAQTLKKIVCSTRTLTEFEIKLKYTVIIEG